MGGSSPGRFCTSMPALVMGRANRASVSSTTLFKSKLPSGAVLIKAQHLAHNPRDSLILGAERLENRLPLWIQFPTKQVNSVFHGFERIIDLMRNGSRQTAGGCEFLHFKHAPLHLQLLEFFPSGEIAQHSDRVSNLTSGIVDFP